MPETHKKEVLKVILTDKGYSIQYEGSAYDVMAAVVATILSLKQQMNIPIEKVLDGICYAAVNTHNEFKDFFEGN